MNTRLKLISLLLSLCMASSLHAALFTNGSFENSMTGWTFSDIDLVLDDTPFSGWEASDGIYSVDLNGFVPGFIEQTFDTVAGETYDVSFDLSGNPGGSSILRTLDVMIDSSTVLSPDYDTVLNGNTENDMMWETHSFSFIADDSSTTLRFESTTAGGFGFPIDAMGPVLDNVSVIASAVPEPAALSLVTMVLLAFILVRRKKLLLS